jgi:hypothetical protein|tara:strand:- start:962 stop:2140 length:1179 start_codon:yes stop_codon:yes gene_type:complete
MKTQITTIILFFVLSVHSQTNEKKIQNEIDKYENEISSDKVYNAKTLNLLFNKNLESYVTSVEVPSLKSLSAVLDNDDNSFAFGYSFDPRNGDATDYLQFLTYVGLKMKGKKEEGFYTIFESDKAKNNIGAEIKATWFPFGSIWTNTKDSPREDIAQNRKTKIKRKAIEEFENKTDLSSNSISDFISKEEVDYILKEDKYNSFSKAWITFRAYYPITNNEYNLVDNSTGFNKSVSEFENWDISFSLNYFRNFNNNNSYTFSIIPKIFNNNNIVTESISSKTFTTSQSTGINQPIQTSTEDFYLGEFDEFTTSQLKAEFTSFFLFNGKAGISAAIEKNYGSKYDPTNWKLGIPVSLKNSKGESDINFEIQWREINKSHFVGISIGKTFGKFVK